MPDFLFLFPLVFLQSHLNCYYKQDSPMLRTVPVGPRFHPCNGLTGLGENDMERDPPGRKGLKRMHVEMRWCLQWPSVPLRVRHGGRQAEKRAVSGDGKLQAWNYDSPQVNFSVRHWESVHAQMLKKQPFHPISVWPGIHKNSFIFTPFPKSFAKNELNQS